MRRGLVGLFVVAVVAALTAGAVANAKGEKGTYRASAQPSPTAVIDRCPLPNRYRPVFQSAARDTHLPLALLVAVARVESNLDHSARSLAGARGLLQVMPPTAAELRLNPDRPASNVLAGARYLKLMLSRFDSSDLALAAYNAGPGAVEEAGGAPGGETIAYVANVNLSGSDRKAVAKTPGIILAAGASTRFGAPKQGILLESVLERVRQSSVDDVLVVLGAHHVKTAARTVRCPEWEQGLGTSLRCGLAALPGDAEAAVVVLADGPDLAPAAIDRVIEVWQESGAEVVAATYGGNRSHPVLLARSIWERIPDGGARGLPALLVPCDDLGPPGDVDFADDLPERFKPPTAGK